MIRLFDRRSNVNYVSLFADPQIEAYKRLRTDGARLGTFQNGLNDFLMTLMVANHLRFVRPSLLVLVGDQMYDSRLQDDELQSIAKRFDSIFRSVCACFVKRVRATKSVCNKNNKPCPVCASNTGFSTRCRCLSPPATTTSAMATMCERAKVAFGARRTHCCCSQLYASNLARYEKFFGAANSVQVHIDHIFGVVNTLALDGARDDVRRQILSSSIHSLIFVTSARSLTSAFQVLRSDAWSFVAHLRQLSLSLRKPVRSSTRFCAIISSFLDPESTS